ncbi:MAG: Rpn family recombination-promoting nuclease/putative transposase [Chitinivibrionia bacterium]|nr:Rpn family recombination-promoting nuclease/putative transposase [Chitinivibrionia bacterium]
METAANREYKSSVFASLFGEKEVLLELYNAINNTNYGKDTDVKMATLDGVLFRGGLQNDLSFMIDDKFVVLIEHQSTVNENMPFRMLNYISEVYKNVIDGKAIYKERKVMIPHPEFIVLYNGEDDYPDHATLKLSNSFKLRGEECPINLEVIVEVYNINKGRNPQFAEKSENLNGYEEFMAVIRANEAGGMDKKEAIIEAVKYCQSHRILEDYLINKGQEVITMLLKEWDLETAQKVREEERVERIAINMLKKGMSVDDVAELTGLFVDDVLRLEY